MPLKNAPARTRELLGALLELRRLELSPDYYERTAFAAATGINLRLVQDLERGGPPNKPRNVTPVTMRDVVAPAYQLTHESIEETITSGEDRLEAAPGTPPRRGAAAAQPHPAAAPVRREDLPAVLQDIDLVALAPYVAQLDRDLAGFVPWKDDYEADTWKNPDMAIDTKRVLISMYRMLRDEQAPGSGRSRTGLEAQPAAAAGNEAASMR